MDNYIVIYKPVNPSTEKCMNNKPYEYKPFVAKVEDGAAKDINSIEPKYVNSDIVERNSNFSKLYDSVFVFNGTKEIAEISSGDKKIGIVADSFINIKGQPWFIFATLTSIEDAKRVAKNIAIRIGINNVKIAKTIEFL